MEEKKAKKSRGLGRGLNALFEGPSFEENIISTVPSNAFDDTEKALGGEVLIKIRYIEPNKNQTRKTFDKEKLEALSESLKNHGLVQPVLVKKETNGMYTIIAGERRWRAAKLAGLKEIPCIIKDYSEKELMEIALIENLQREDLNPIEEAEGYRSLMKSFDMTQEDVAQRVGKSRSAVANALRLNNLCSEVKEMVVSGILSQGHARALLPISDEKTQKLFAEKIVKEELTVRQTEKMVSLYEKNGTIEKEEKTNFISPSVKKYYSEIENSLSKKFGTKVKIHPGKNKSRIEFEYYSNEDLERILFELK